MNKEKEEVKKEEVKKEEVKKEEVKKDETKNGEVSKETTKEPNQGVTESEEMEFTQEFFEIEMKKQARDYCIIGILVGILLMLITFIGLFKNQLHITWFTNKGNQVVTTEVQNKLKTLNGLLGNDFLYPVDEEYLEEMMIRGYIAGLGDVYASYYNEEETVSLRESTSGEYSGIGAVLSQNMSTMTITVSSVFINSPAEEEGLKTGDIIIEVDGEDIEGQDLTSVVSNIKGESDTKVTIKIDRNGKEIEKTLTRRVVESPTVEYEMLEDDIAYINITEFDTVTLNQFRSAMERAEEDGMEGLILDVRNNPGGSLKIVVEMLDELLPEGLLVYTEDKDGERTEFNATGKDEFEKPLVVLVNRYSASASEIFAGAIKDYDLATLVGNTTYGKGVVQQIVDLGDGTSVKYTISEYFTASGNTINKQGIAPHIEVDLNNENPEVDEQLNEGIKVLKENN